MKNKKKSLVFIALILFTALFSAICSAWNPPPRGIDYRGFAFNDDNSTASDGTIVSIWANEGSLKMDEVILQYGNGYFNNLKVIWDDPDTAADEGITYDGTTLEHIRFKINERFTKIPAYSTVRSAEEGSTFDIMLYSEKTREEALEIPEEEVPSHSAGIPLTREEEKPPVKEEEKKGEKEGETAPGKIKLPFLETPLSMPASLGAWMTLIFVAAIILALCVLTGIMIFKRLAKEYEIKNLIKSIEEIEKIEGLKKRDN
jgi:hypothetical protein